MLTAGADVGVAGTGVAGVGVVGDVGLLYLVSIVDRINH